MGWAVSPYLVNVLHLVRLAIIILLVESMAEVVVEVKVVMMLLMLSFFVCTDLTFSSCFAVHYFHHHLSSNLVGLL